MKHPAVRSVLAPLLAALSLYAGGCARQAVEHHGEPFTTAPMVSLAQLIETPQTFHRQPVRIEGRIERQCPAAGCWFFLSDTAGHSVRVELGDYHPTLPQRIGYEAEVEGEWVARGERHEFIGTRVTFRKIAEPAP